MTSDSGAFQPSSPKVNGIVRASVPDGSGGWYIGGDFKDVGPRIRQGLAHILADGRVDTEWVPRVSGSVYALARTSTGIAVGGSFTAISDVPATNLALLDATTGARLAGTSVSANARVRALAVSGDRLYAAGDFTSVNGVARNRIVRLTPTGSIDSLFNAHASGSVMSLAVHTESGTVYAGGSFTQAAGGGSGWTTRSRLVGYATSNGALSSFAPAADNTVQALDLDASGNVYAGGLFSTVGGVARARLAQLTAAGGVGALNAALNGCQVRHTLKDANTNPLCTPEVSSLEVVGGSLYVGGRFGQSGTVKRHDAAGFDLSSGALTAWDPVPGDRPLTLSSSGGSMFVGGEFTSVGGQLRAGLAAYDASTGALLPDRADTDNFVSAVESSADGKTLYLGGAFTTVQGQPRTRVAAVDVATGVVVPGFKPVVNNNVLELSHAQGSLYIGGKFTKVNRMDRGHAAKLNGTTGALDSSWIVNTTGPTGPLRGNGMVMGIAAAPDGSKVFLAGPFTSVNGVTTTGGILVVDGTTGARSPRQLGGVQGCSSIGPWINRMYLSEDGRRLYGGDVCPDYVYQWDAVNLSSSTNPTGLIWRTWCNGGMQGRYEVNGHFYYGTHGGNEGSGGTCLDRPGGTQVSQQRFYAFDADNGYLLPDAPEFDTPMGVWSYGSVPGGLLVGGDFTFAGARGQTQQGLAFFPGTP